MMQKHNTKSIYMKSWSNVNTAKRNVIWNGLINYLGMQSPFENRQRQFNMLNCFVANWRYADLLPSSSTLSRHCFVLNSFSLLIISAWPKCMLCIVICVSIYCDMWMVVSLRMSWIFVPSISVGCHKRNLYFCNLRVRTFRIWTPHHIFNFPHDFI